METIQLSYKEQKHLSRMLAIAMADDGAIGAVEMREICNIIQERGGKRLANSFDQIYNTVEEQHSTLNSSSSERHSIFMNLDSLSDKDVEREIRDVMRVIVADNSITDRERVAFSIYCKFYRIKHPAVLWQTLSQLSIDEIKDARKSPIKINRKKIRTQLKLQDFQTIHEALEFYGIHSPILDGVSHMLQREKSRFSEQIHRSNRRWSYVAFSTFAICAAIIYLFISLHAISSRVNEDLHQVIISLCVAGMMLSIEWLIFMRSSIQLENEAENKAENNSPHSHSPSLIVFVAIAIVLDICIGIVEVPTEKLTAIVVLYKVLSAFTLGALCFFIGKFVENHRDHQMHDVTRMDEIIEELSKGTKVPKQQ